MKSFFDEDAARTLELLAREMEKDFPFRKAFSETEFGYIVPLTGGRGRINVTTIDNELFVRDFY